MNVALVEGHEALEPGLQRRPVRRHVRAPQAVALLEAHRLERPVAEVDEAEILAGRAERVVERAAGPRSGGAAPSRARPRTRRAAASTRARPISTWRARKKRKPSFEKSSRETPLQQLARARPGDREHAVARRHVVDAHRAVRGSVALDPREVVRLGRGGRHDVVAAGREQRHRDVGLDAAAAACTSASAPCGRPRWAAGWRTAGRAAPRRPRR